MDILMGIIVMVILVVGSSKLADLTVGMNQYLAFSIWVGFLSITFYSAIWIMR